MSRNRFLRQPGNWVSFQGFQDSGQFFVPGGNPEVPVTHLAIG
ncbi:MAG TPA: hypothetical protein VFL96_05175 [Acidobacteriaceae bacterium]|nr:hypothetical protein [Acidobacteriaceae bacterium]